MEKIEEEVTREGQPFRRKPVFNFMLRYLCPIFAAIILASSVANALLDRDVTLFSARKKPPACILTAGAFRSFFFKHKEAERDIRGQLGQGGQAGCATRGVFQ